MVSILTHCALLADILQVVVIPILVSQLMLMLLHLTFFRVRADGILRFVMLLIIRKNNLFAIITLALPLGVIGSNRIV
nr:MAG TPA: hypothetical protein [Caudoviricetes sp.]